ncbi:hypothetical protein TWF281_009308 [Arthrobotrys megalospora]
MLSITWPEGTKQFAYERAASVGFPADDVYHNEDWNYHSHLTKGAADVFKGIERHANDALIAALTATKKVVIQVRQTLPANLPLEDYINLCTVHRPDGKLLGTFNPLHKYDEGVQIKEVGSRYGGIVTVPPGWKFANVIGSGPDPKGRVTSWLALWSAAYGSVTPVGCTSLNFPSTVTCGASLLGGHVIAGTVASTVPTGSNTVRIFPICDAHHDNNDVYMEALTRQNGVWLTNYMHMA